MNDLKVIPISYINSSKIKDLEPGRYVIADMKKNRILRVIEILAQPENLELEYIIVAKNINEGDKND